MQIPLLTCPRCLGLIVNPNAAAEKPPPPLPGAQRRVEPRMVIPIEEEADYDLRGTVVGLVLLALVILGGEWAVLFVLRQTALSVVLIGAAMITAGGVIYVNRRAKVQQATLPVGALRGGTVLEYQQTRPQVSVLAFLGGFIIAIAIGIICFYVLVATGERTAVATRRLVFAGVVVMIVGLIIAAINLRRV